MDNPNPNPVSIIYVNTSTSIMCLTIGIWYHGGVNDRVHHLAAPYSVKSAGEVANPPETFPRLERRVLNA
jgi:hypothetical protein